MGIITWMHLLEAMSRKCGVCVSGLGVRLKVGGMTLGLSSGSLSWRRRQAQEFGVHRTPFAPPNVRKAPVGVQGPRRVGLVLKVNP